VKLVGFTDRYNLASEFLDVLFASSWLIVSIACFLLVLVCEINDRRNH
jgi:hypothetical protein